MAPWRESKPQWRNRTCSRFLGTEVGIKGQGGEDALVLRRGSHDDRGIVSTCQAQMELCVGAASLYSERRHCCFPFLFSCHLPHPGALKDSCIELKEQELKLLSEETEEKLTKCLLMLIPVPSGKGD